jgi:glycosyltransferase involved in cell wall biosynthesis
VLKPGRLRISRHLRSSVADLGLSEKNQRSPQVLSPRGRARTLRFGLASLRLKRTPRFLGDRARDARDWTRTVQYYRKALEENPDDFPIWVQYGHALKETAQIREAESAYRKSIELADDIADTHLQLGHVLKIQGRKEEAAFAYLGALVLDPALHHATLELLGLGWTFSGINEWIVDYAQRSQHRDTTRREKQPTKSADSFTTIVFDISDLIDYFSHSRSPTGVQRVQINVISSLIRSNRHDFELVVACCTPQTDFWVRVPECLFLHVANLALANGDRDDLAWRSALREIDLLLAATRPLEFASGAILVNIGTSWWLANYFLMVRSAKSKYGIRYVPFVHDCIPIVVPEIVPKAQTEEFLRWLIGVFFHADAFLVNSKASAADLVKYAELLGHDVPKPHVIRLDGRSFAETKSAEAGEEGRDERRQGIIERNGLKPKDFVLFVATIELRKNHLLAFDAWLALIKKRGVQNMPPLVCVGKRGWGADAPLAFREASELLQKRVLILTNIADDELAALYRECLFTLFPSTYEGWGLPITEALSYGKVPLTSTESSLPEVGGELAEYFDLQSERDLLEKLERLIDDSAYREACEARIRENFRPREWADIGDDIVANVLAANDALTAVASSEPRSDARISSLPAEIGRYYAIARNFETTASPGLVCGEMYRIGDSWWHPEDWGTWIKRHRADIAFSMRATGNRPYVLYLGLHGIPHNPLDYRVSAVGGDLEESGSLRPNEERWVMLRIPAELLQRDTIQIRLMSNARTDLREVRNGGDACVITLGVVGFYVCPEDDLRARHQFVEALQLNRLRTLNGQPTEVKGLLTLLEHRRGKRRNARAELDNAALSKERAFEIAYGRRPSAAETEQLRHPDLAGGNEPASQLRSVIACFDRQRLPTPLSVRFTERDLERVECGGFSLVLDRCDISVSRSIIASQQYEPHLSAFVRRIVKPGMTAVDIGANVGFYTMLLGERVGRSGRVLAFEPNTENCRLLMLSIDANGFNHIKLYPFALSTNIGAAFFTT